MARPKSEDKRDAILAAAVRVIAERGLSATPTSSISKAAGVAEGSLFTYFKTKDALVNALYLELKREMAEVLIPNFPHDADFRGQLLHIWNEYVTWGVANQDKKRVMDQLMVSSQISEESRRIGAAPFANFDKIIDANVANRVLRNYPQAFIAGSMASLADMTMGFIGQKPEEAALYRNSGFDLLWNGIANR
jgi:AcrR family transcriptional regulator